MQLNTHLNADIMLVIKLVAIWTPASVTTRCVKTITACTRILLTFVVIDALIVIRMNNIAIRTTTPEVMEIFKFKKSYQYLSNDNCGKLLIVPVSAHDVLASFLTFRIVCTLIGIQAVSSRRIQFETSRADTLETSKNVDTSSRFWTYARFITFVNI